MQSATAVCLQHLVSCTTPNCIVLLKVGCRERAYRAPPPPSFLLTDQHETHMCHTASSLPWKPSKAPLARRRVEYR